MDRLFGAVKFFISRSIFAAFRLPEGTFGAAE
jgi:hypothetical protein